MTKMPGEGDIDTQHNGGQVCGKKIISLGVEGFEPENNRCDNIVYTLCISAPGAAKRGRESERKQQEMTPMTTKQTKPTVHTDETTKETIPKSIR